MILKNIRFLITQNSEREIRENLDLRIQNSVISEFGEDLKGEKVIDCSDKIVLPGLVNCHTHISMTLLRGISDNKPVDQWLEEEILPAENKMSPDMVEMGAELGIREMLKTGTTCFNDMYAPEGKVASAVKKYGIRSFLGEGMIDKGKDTSEEIESSRNFIEKRIDEELITPVLNPHAVYTCSEKVFEKTVEDSKKFDIPIHTHVSETESENKEFLDKTGKTPIKFLEEKDILDRKIIAAHCTNLEGTDLELLDAYNAGVAHCPSANAKLGSGIANVSAMIEKGIKVGLGTDGPASNNSLNMFQEMKTAALMQKLDDPEKMTPQMVLDMATFEGAKVLGMEKTGRVKQDWKADLIAVELNESLRPLRRDNIVSHLVFSDPDVQHTVVNGEILMEDGDIPVEFDKELFEGMSQEIW